MEAALPEHLESLLRFCAILRAFDAETLHILTDATAADVQTLLDHGWIVSLPGTPTRYTMADDRRQAALTRLRRQRPRDEIDRHAQVFHHYTQQLQSRGI